VHGVVGRQNLHTHTKWRKAGRQARSKKRGKDQANQQTQRDEGIKEKRRDEHNEQEELEIKQGMNERRRVQLAQLQDSICTN